MKMVDIGLCRLCKSSIYREEGARGRKPVYCADCRENPEEIKQIEAAAKREAGDRRAQRLIELLQQNQLSDEERRLRLEEAIQSRDYGGKKR